jgi:alkylhydroperoxidase family enzyme
MNDLASPVHELCPQLAEGIEHYYPLLSAVVDPSLVELCRRRIAQITGASEVMVTRDGSRLSAAQLEALAEWYESDQFDARDKACLEYVEYFCYSVQSVTDEQVAALRAHLSSEQIFGLTVACWLSDSFHRLSNFLGLVAPAENAR